MNHPKTATGDAPATAELMPRARRWQPQDIAPWVSLAVIVLFFALASPSFARPATLVQILKQGSALGIVAVGLTFVLLCAEIDLSVGFVALWSACLCGWLAQRYGGLGGEPALSGLALALVAPLLSSLLIGTVAGWLTVRAGLPSFIITLAVMNIAAGSARWLTQSETLDVPAVLKTLGNRGLEGEALGRFMVPYSALLTLAVFLAAHAVLAHTRFGRFVYMTGGNREAARLSGVPVRAVVIACLAISSVLAGLGGLITAGRLNSVSQDQNADLLLSAVACVVLGGTSLFGGEGSMLRTALGVCTFTVLNVGLAQIQWVNDLARQALMGVVLLVALVINGLLSLRGR